MRAAVIEAYGAQPVLTEFDDPRAGADTEVLELVAAALNPVDIRIASGTYPGRRPSLPYVAGNDAVGRRADGSLVYVDTHVAPFGAFAPRTLVATGAGYPVPRGLDPALAAALGIAGLAAWVALQWRARLAPGESVLVLGASGAVGQIAVQAARLLGAGRVVAAARDPDGLQRAGELGADALVALTPAAHAGGDATTTVGPGADALTAALLDAAGGPGFDVVFDPLWGEPGLAAMAALRPYGRQVNLGQSAGAAATLTSALVRTKPIELLGYTNFSAPREVLAAAYGRLAEHALAGELRLAIERLGLDDVPRAWERQPDSPGAKLTVVF